MCMEILFNTSGHEFVAVKNKSDEDDYMLIDVLSGKMFTAYNAKVFCKENSSKKYIDSECNEIGIYKDIIMERPSSNRDVYIKKLMDLQSEYMRCCLEKSIIIRENINNLSEEDLRQVCKKMERDSGNTTEQKIDDIVESMNAIYIPERKR